MNTTKEDKLLKLNLIATTSDEKASWLKQADWNKKHELALNDFSTIAIRILSTLKKRNMKQIDLANLLDVKPQALSRIVKGRQNLTLSKIRQIEKALDIRLITVTPEKLHRFQIELALDLRHIEYTQTKIAFEQQIQKDIHNAKICKESPTYSISPAA